ncbi:MAG: hypothetical protein N2045_02095 [Fimbriimonadales bacterium]|jgi:hypothetical protein|nr:hypothetical protein [Fimbriimonadales bacterium]GBC89492.1 hypothetical protein HRbin14_00217 [bacterium HR14]
MRKIRNILTVVLTLAVAPMVMAQFGGDHVFVRGYFRRDGTYVRPHYRTRPDGYFWNNWSSYGNINPYTGKIGTRFPSYDLYITRLPAPGYSSLHRIDRLYGAPRLGRSHSLLAPGNSLGWDGHILLAPGNSLGWDW